MIRSPGMRNFLSGITLIDAPWDIICVTFNIHSSPIGGSMMIFEQEGSVEGGTLPLLQFVGSLQFPAPVKV